MCVPPSWAKEVDEAGLKEAAFEREEASISGRQVVGQSIELAS